MPWLPPSPLLLIRPQDVQVHPRAAILAPGAEDRVLLGCVQVASSLPALGNWGLLTCYLHAVLTGHTLNALPFPVRKVDGK